MGVFFGFSSPGGVEPALGPEIDDLCGPDSDRLSHGQDKFLHDDVISDAKTSEKPWS